MYNLETIPPVSQLIVLGRGKEGEYKLSTASYDRATVAQAYCDAYPGVETVIFSSGYSSQTALNVQANTPSEARLMADVAQLPEGVEVILEQESSNTLENILNAADLLDREKPTGILAHRAQLTRALVIADRIELANSIYGIRAELLGARPEGWLTTAIEAAQLIRTKGLLYGINNGDIARTRARNDAEKQFIAALGSGLRKFCSLTKIPVPQQYR